MNTIDSNEVPQRELYYDFKSVEHLHTEWDECVEVTGGDIYLTYDWCRAWWDFYGEKRDLQIFVYKCENKLVGILPVFYEKQWLGPVWLKIAKIVGSDSTMVMINPPVVAEFAKVFWGDIFDSVLNTKKCDAFWVGPTGGKYNGLQQLQEAMSEQTEIMLFKKNVHSPYTTFFLPGTFDEYVQSLNKRQRGNLRRDLNLINRSFAMSQDVIQDEVAANSEFPKFAQMHAEQWETEGKLGHFHDWPKGIEFHSRLVNEQAKKGRLRLIRLLANGVVVSYQLCYVFGKRLYWRLPARAVGSEWDKFALGRIGLVKEIEMAIAEGVREIEAGAGHYEYKIKLGGEEHPLYTFLVTRKQRSSRWRAYLFLKLSSVLHYIYYRVWFNRLAPKLPFRRKPLWRKWIRARL